MKEKKLLIIFAVLAAIVTIFNAIGNVCDTFFYSMDDLPEGTFMEVYESPDGQNEVSVYLVDNALGTAIRCDVTCDGGYKNIYWVTGIDSAKVTWKSNSRVTINGVTLDIADGSYDSRMVNEELDSFLEENIF